jgi:hypothetical protein
MREEGEEARKGEVERERDGRLGDNLTGGLEEGDSFNG